MIARLDSVLFFPCISYLDIKYVINNEFIKVKAMSL